MTAKMMTLNTSQPRAFSASVPGGVVARGDAVGIPLHQRHSQVIRRRVDIPLAVPGAEMRLPSIPALRVGWRALSGLLVVLIAVVLVFVWQSPGYRVAGTQLSGLQHLNARDLNTVLAVAGKPIFAVDAGWIESFLTESFPEVESVRVTVTLPNLVSISVRERQPVLAWQRDGVVVWVTADGLAYNPRGAPEPPISVRVEGPPPRLPNWRDAPNGSVRLLTPETTLAFQRLQAVAPPEARLIYHPQYGLGWEDPQGWRVYFGLQVEDLDTKIEVYQSLVTYLQQNRLQPVMINLTQIHAPYYRLEN